MIEANGVAVCTESFGDPADVPILLVMGVGASMLWWEEGFCRMLADSGRFVIRYDHRDTGRSVTYEPGCPGYTAADLVADAVGVLDAYGVPAAHVVGVSAGGAFAQLLALGFPGQVLSLVLISTSPAMPGDRDLPASNEDFARFVTTATVDWSDDGSVIEYLVDYSRVLAGGRRPFDQAAVRELVRRDVSRARPCPRSRRRRWSSTAPPIRCSRSSTGRRWLRRSLAQHSCPWRELVTASNELTGKRSPGRSSSTPADLVPAARCLSSQHTTTALITRQRPPTRDARPSVSFAMTTRQRCGRQTAPGLPGLGHRR